MQQMKKCSSLSSSLCILQLRYQPPAILPNDLLHVISLVSCLGLDRFLNQSVNFLSFVRPIPGPVALDKLNQFLAGSFLAPKVVADKRDQRLDSAQSLAPLRIFG